MIPTASFGLQEKASVDRRTYHTLDGMRGVAALFVVALHTAYAFHPLSFPNAFIAVDLFFVLSGFVIAAAYDRRLGSGALTPARFLILRYIRLWPLYLLGTVLGLLILHSKMTHGKASIDPATFRAIIPFSLLMIPSVLTPGILYPASTVAWTLFYELVINILYAATFRWLGAKQLVAVAAVAAIGVVAASLSSASLNNGFAWPTSWIGIARVAYSFPVGILLYRYHQKLPRIQISAWVVLLVLAGLLAVPATANTLYVDIAVLVLLPALVAIAVNSEPPPRWIGIFNLLGVTSYAVYVLHPPLLTCIDWFCDRLGITYARASPWSGIVFLALIFTVAWLVDRLYDRPVRSWLTAMADTGARRHATGKADKPDSPA